MACGNLTHHTREYIKTYYTLPLGRVAWQEQYVHVNI